jgi:hypothetical protein
MRLRAISRMRALMRPLTSMLPSASLCSCLASWWLIFSRLASMRRCSGTSTTANTASTTHSSISPSSRAPPVCASAAGSGMVSASWNWPMCSHSQAPPTTPRISASKLALARSPRCWPETMRPRPASGLSLPKLGSSGCQVKFQPPEARAAPTASRMPMAPSGSSTAIQAQVRLPSWCVMASDAASVCASKRRPRASSRPAQSARRGNPRTSSAPPRPTTSRWLRSRERATWPSRRALRIFFSEAGSLRSWASAMAMRARMEALTESSAPGHGAARSPLRGPDKHRGTPGYRRLARNLKPQAGRQRELTGHSPA